MVTVDITKRFVITVLVTAAVTAFGTLYAWPKLHPKEAACHDSIYVYPLGPTEDEDPRIDFPGKKMVFTCPHSQHKMELVGHGGFTCKCDSYHRSE
jgi:hypothetical protein